MLISWQEFLRGKKKRQDVMEFLANLMDNILSLHNELKEKTYQHGGYQHFKINDPKPRDIHKASVRDRLLHHAIYRVLYPYFDRKFIFDSYSCRLIKGTHRAINRFKEFSYKVSRNNTQGCWVLKCDIRKFFANIDHKILMGILGKFIGDTDVLWLLDQIISSFNTKNKKGVGLPLGNLTSQLLVNIYMNKFDQFLKHNSKINYYIRYADDFVLLANNADYLWAQVKPLRKFLYNELKLTLHPNKISITTLNSGVDFLGHINFFNYSILRTKTKKRMLKRENEKNNASYLGLLKHCCGYKLRNIIIKYQNNTL